MDSSAHAVYADLDDCLQIHEFGEELRRRNTNEVQDFRSSCGEFFDHFVDVILSHHTVASEFVHGVYCFRPGLLLEGDDVFLLFKKLVRVFENSDAVYSANAQTAVDEFRSYVVDVRAPHSSGSRSAKTLWTLCRIDFVIMFSCRGEICVVFLNFAVLLTRNLRGKILQITYVWMIVCSCNHCDVLYTGGAKLSLFS